MTDEEQLRRRVATMRTRLKGFRILGGSGVAVQGSFERGYAISAEKRGAAVPVGFGEPINGCTDPAAVNYNPSATVDDGSCIYPVYGCTDPVAENFDPVANLDDGSCLYAMGACCLDTDCFITRDIDCDGIYQGDDTTCTPNPCVVLGACCDAGVCSEVSIEDCAGIYEGDGVSCASVDCSVPGCTDPAADNFDPEATVDDGSCEYTCPAITMLCDSASASGSKCGFSFGGKKWLTQVQTTHSASTRSFTIFNYNCGAPPGGNAIVLPEAHFTIEYDVFAEQVKQYVNLECSLLMTSCSQGGHITTTSDVRTQNPECPTDSCNTGFSNIVNTGSCSFPSASPPAPAFTISCDLFTCGVFVPECGFVNVWNTTSPPTVITYDDEFTTSMLISETNNNLVYSGSYTGGACDSGRFLSSDENTYSVQRSKPKFTFTPVGFPFYITYVEHYTGDC